MKMSNYSKFLLTLSVLFLSGKLLQGAGTATSVYGLYYTGVNDQYGLLTNGTDSHWDVSYARVNGTGSTSSAYTGTSYVVSGTYIDGGWVPNSSTSRWITAPGASTAGTGGTTNIGGDDLPGNGTTNVNSAYFVYHLTFQITGTGSGTVSNNVAISLTIAADDQYAVYVNPGSTPTVDAAGAITAGSAVSATGFSAWNNTTSIGLQNFGSGAANNAKFKIGANDLYIVVANTNSQTGQNNSTALNPSGLLVYQVGATATIGGTPVPEVGAVLPVFAAVGMFGWRRFRRGSKSAS